VVQGNPTPFLAVPGLCNKCLARFIFSLEEESDVVEALAVKNIVGKNHRANVVDDQSCLLKDLSLAACFKRLPGFQVPTGQSPGSRTVRSLSFANKDLTVFFDKYANSHSNPLHQ
jgi:hypothetical protein